MKMTSIIKILSKVIFTVLLAIAAETAYAQPGSGGGGPGGAEGPGGTGGAEGIPVDGGVGAFLVAGAALGAKKLHSHYKKSKELK